MGIFDCTEGGGAGGGAGLEINDELMFKQQTAGIRWGLYPINLWGPVIIL